MKFLTLLICFSSLCYCKMNIKDFCSKIDTRFKSYNWEKSSCQQTQWKSVRQSHYGHPIMWTEFRPQKITKTMILLCGVHPDEITPSKFCFDIIKNIQKDFSKIKNTLTIIAPLVTPDPFFFKKPTRTNARKVDVNRNFPTKDWDKMAHKLWRTKYYSQKRRFPGKKALSEQETIFQVNLIKLYKPDLIVSVHAPLQLIDYDGPKISAQDHMVKKMSKLAGNYKVHDYPYFTGSLGNWAGKERSIPTLTFELPNSDWNKTKLYYKKFSPAIFHAITSDFDENEKELKSEQSK